jgi:chromosomal replication initiation ATPase DnaA
MRGKAIIREVMRQFNIGPKDFFGTSRVTHLVNARRDAIRQLTEAGFSLAAIARLTKRHYSTVQYWTHPSYRERQIAYSLNYWREQRAA